MIKNIFIYSTFAFLILFIAFPVFSQADIIEYTDGVIVDISSTEITISEYEIDNDEHNNVTFIINEDTEIIGVDSIDELSNNDIVEIEYTVKDDVKIALTIYVEEFSGFEE